MIFWIIGLCVWVVICCLLVSMCMAAAGGDEYDEGELHEREQRQR